MRRAYWRDGARETPIYARSLVSLIVDVLKIAPGQKISDVGSGEGPFIFPPAERTGETGVFYAVDTNPEAMRKVERLAQKRRGGQCLA